MNLVAYDNVESVVDKRRTWLDVHKKVLYSREFTYRKYNCFGKRFDANENHSIFYVIMTDDEPLDRPASKTIITNNGCIKIGIKAIWAEAGLNRVTTKYLNVIVKHTEHTDDGDIYELDFNT